MPDQQVDSPSPTPAADVPVVILCGGMGTRIREASDRLPKPMIDIGGRPILWHIMKLYDHHGFRKFVLPTGYMGDKIRDFFLHYREHLADVTIDLRSGAAPIYHGLADVEDWEITIADTGVETMTGARISRVRDHVDGDTFAVTYGDGIADIDLAAGLAFHQSHDAIGTVTGVHPTSRFGELNISGDTVDQFAEKPELHEGWVNGGFFFFDRGFFDYVDDRPDLVLEQGPMQKLSADGQLQMFRHVGFWRGMDTYREYVELNGMWDRGEAAWKLWA